MPCELIVGNEYPALNANANVPDVVTGDPPTLNPVGADNATLVTVPELPLETLPSAIKNCADVPPLLINLFAVRSLTNVAFPLEYITNLLVIPLFISNPPPSFWIFQMVPLLVSLNCNVGIDDEIAKSPLNDPPVNANREFKPVFTAFTLGYLVDDAFKLDDKLANVWNVEFAVAKERYSV